MRLHHIQHTCRRGTRVIQQRSLWLHLWHSNGSYSSFLFHFTFIKTLVTVQHTDVTAHRQDRTCSYNKTLEGQAGKVTAVKMKFPHFAKLGDLPTSLWSLPLAQQECEDVLC